MCWTKVIFWCNPNYLAIILGVPKTFRNVFFRKMIISFWYHCFLSVVNFIAVTLLFGKDINQTLVLHKKISYWKPRPIFYGILLQDSWNWELDVLYASLAWYESVRTRFTFQTSWQDINQFWSLWRQTQPPPLALCFPTKSPRLLLETWGQVL